MEIVKTFHDYKNNKRNSSSNNKRSEAVGICAADIIESKLWILYLKHNGFMKTKTDHFLNVIFVLIKRKEISKHKIRTVCSHQEDCRQAWVTQGDQDTK